MRNKNEQQDRPEQQQPSPLQDETLLQKMTPYIGAIADAWEELRINKGRVMLSLVGVAAAVWAMATVIALGDIMSSSQLQLDSQYSGVPGTVRLSASGQGASDESYETTYGSASGSTSDSSSGSTVTEFNPDGSIRDDFGAAALRTVDTVDATLWTRERTTSAGLQAPGVGNVQDFSGFDGVPLDDTYTGDAYADTTFSDSGFSDSGFSDSGISEDDFAMNIPGGSGATSVELLGVDPGWMEIYQKRVIDGRELNADDGNKLMNPVMINEKLYELLGNPDVKTYPQFWLADSPNVQFTVVGVLKGLGTWDGPQAVMPYETFVNALPPGLTSQQASLTVATPYETASKNQDVLVSILQAELGESWSVNGMFSEKDQFGAESFNSVMTKVVAAIGGIVIALGALGLLTVSIVTIRHRVREIGIRRAMGASVHRVFISVFMESVVATTVAGVIGVILSIFTIKFLPIEDMFSMPLPPGDVAYPFTAALIGVLIAAGVGALAGIIPASIAVKVTPIDAIRF